MNAETSTQNPFPTSAEQSGGSNGAGLNGDANRVRRIAQSLHEAVDSLEQARHRNDPLAEAEVFRAAEAAMGAGTAAGDALRGVVRDIDALLSPEFRRPKNGRAKTAFHCGHNFRVCHVLQFSGWVQASSVASSSFFCSKKECSVSIFRCRRISPSSSASGRGGQPEI